ncbi:MAG: GyrI-like domain-containing protein [Anaerolineales bacterium]|nr:GyrI-like domain-containing protein [Anaerolineales bacterium]
MNDLEVRIVTLPPLRVICFNGFGPSPERLAFDKASAWLKANGMWEDGQQRRFFGYNNPDPSPGSPNYGYDVWVTVDETVQAGGDGHIIEFPGGLYAVTRVEAGPRGEGIYETWQALAAWVEHSQYKPEYCRRPCLEESPDPFHSPPGGFTLDLYEPISG